MPIRPVAFGTFAFAALVLAGPAWAQSLGASPSVPESSPAPSASPAPQPAKQTAAPAAPPAPPALPNADDGAISERPAQYAPAPSHWPAGDEGRRARAILDVLATRERTIRLTSAYGGLIGGATILGLGVLAETREISTAPSFWILGGSVAALGISSLVLRGPLETLSIHAESQSDAALRESWGAAARAARKDRLFGGWLSVGLGAGAAIAGTTLAAGAGDMTSKARTGWSAGLLVGGGVMAGAGIAALLIRSPAEDGYQSAYGTEAPPLTLGLTPLPGGGAVSVSGTF